MVMNIISAVFAVIVFTVGSASMAQFNEDFYYYYGNRVSNYYCIDINYYCIDINYKTGSRYYPMTWLGTTMILYRGILWCRSPECRDLPSVAMSILLLVMSTKVS